ncbi:MAG: hypothetical protein ABIS29_12305 [Vicinamibacterales bacterium]
MLICLIGLGAALLLVGVVSGTVLRHVIQIVPIAAAAGVLARRPDWGAYAAVPIFIFWICIVGLIWLFLLGVFRIADGDYTLIEVGATVLMAGFCVVGVRRAISVGKALPPLARLFAIVLFAFVQVGAMWVSFLRPFANR